jgi:alpha-1,2-mannosyltransferase
VVWLVTWSLLGAFATWHRGFDLDIYRHALHWWWDGQGLYSYRQPRDGGLGFTYPPFAALALTPLAVLPAGVAEVVLVGVNLAIVTVGGWWLARPLGLPGWFVLALALPLGVALEPVRETIGFGQVNLLLAAMVLLDAVLLAQGRRTVAGFGIGLAAAVKLTPAIFLLYLVLRREWRPALNAVAAGAGATVLAAVVDPRGSWQYWTETLWATSRVGRYDSTPNQSLMGLLARVLDDPMPPVWAWTVLAGAVLAVGLARAVRAGDEITGCTLVGLTGCLVSAISWSDLLVWVLPAVVLLLRRRQFVAAALTYAVTASSVIWAWRRDAPHHWELGLPGIVQENAYVLVLVALVLWLPTRSDRSAPCLRRGHPCGMPSGERCGPSHGPGKTRTRRTT